MAVLDRPEDERATVSRDLNAAADSGFARNPSATKIPIRVQPPCHSSKELLAAYDELKGITYLDDGTWGYYLSPKDSAWHLVTSQPERVTGLEGLKTGAIVVEPGGMAPAMGGRYNDAQPHWGGARVTRRADGKFCSAGFTVNGETSSVGQAMVTAGHCYVSGAVVDSGAYYYGRYVTRGNFPTYDSALINASDQNYDDNIYDGEASTSTANNDIDGTDTVADGDLFCVSGSVSRNVCSVEVTSLTAFLDQGGGRTTSLIRGEKIGSIITWPGDSGGPAYVGTGPSQIIGSIVGGHDPDETGSYDWTLVEKYFHTQNNLDVCVATTPTWVAC